MANCVKCGKELAEGPVFCTECGAKAEKVAEETADQISEGAETFPKDIKNAEEEKTAVKEEIKQETVASVLAQPYKKPAAPPVQQTWQVKPQADKRTKVLSTSSFFWSIFIMSLPVLGFLITVIWACGGAKNENRKNLARSFLILMVVAVVACALLALFALVIFKGQFSELLRRTAEVLRMLGER